MAETSNVTPVKLFCGNLFSGEDIKEILSELEHFYGPIDYVSPVFPFDFTDYYTDEMGRNIKRVFYSFEKLILPDILPDIKLKANELEQKYLYQEKRTVNIDPGYIDYHKIVLASVKSGGQKIYMGKGIYADITLWYEKGKFIPFPWTFMDFKSKSYDRIFLKIREIYKKQIKHLVPN